MSHPAARAAPILTVADALGMKLVGRKAHCYNGRAHKSGEDARPALVFFPDSGRFKCYACGVQGDAIDLVRAVQGSSFTAAVQWLTDLVGQGTMDRKVLGTSSPRARTPDAAATQVYARLYELSFELGPQLPGGGYLRKRGINVGLANQLKVRELGDTRRVWDDLAHSFEESQLRSAGILSRSGKLLFARHRLLFFHFVDDWPQYVQARDIDGDASCKELSPTGLCCPAPYNADLLKQRPEQVLVCEGCIDTLSALQLGHAAVGVPGVMGFREEWFQLFRAVRHVCLVFDNDEAGRRQSAELRARFRLRGMRADAWHPQRGKDVNDLLKSLSHGVLA